MKKMILQNKWMVLSALFLVYTNNIFAQIPTTKLIDGQCGGRVDPYGNFSFYSDFQFDPIPNAEDYYIVVRNVPGNPYFYSSGPIGSSNPRISPFEVSNMMSYMENYFNSVYAVTFSVRVSAKVNGVWAPALAGEMCEVDVYLKFKEFFQRKPRPEVNYNDLNIEMNIYPNPLNAKDKGFDVNFTDLSLEVNRIQIQVVDLFGREVYSKQITQGNEDLTTRVDFKEVPASGTYLLRVNINGEPFIHKLQIR